MCDFAKVNEDEVSEYATKPSFKLCSLDPLPSPVFKDCLEDLLPTITKIVNLSLSNGVMPDALKTAELLPSLKKLDADYKQFSNFRSISNLMMISKVVEKVVAVQLTDYIASNHLVESLQSAYRLFHSTETALVQVQNDILPAVDENKSVILLLLDLSATFATEDHSIYRRRDRLIALVLKEQP